MSSSSLREPNPLHENAQNYLSLFQHLPQHPRSLFPAIVAPYRIPSYITHPSSTLLSPTTPLNHPPPLLPSSIPFLSLLHPHPLLPPHPSPPLSPPPSHHPTITLDLLSRRQRDDYPLHRSTHCGARGGSGGTKKREPVIESSRGPVEDCVAEKACAGDGGRRREPYIGIGVAGGKPNVDAPETRYDRLLLRSSTAIEFTLAMLISTFLAHFGSHIVFRTMQFFSRLYLLCGTISKHIDSNPRLPG